MNKLKEKELLDRIAILESRVEALEMAIIQMLPGRVGFEVDRRVWRTPYDTGTYIPPEPGPTCQTQPNWT